MPITPEPTTLSDLHTLVKMGDADAALTLYEEFSTGARAPGGVDTARADRYGELSIALEELGDGLKLPNLDRAIPLPPVKLPHWDGKRQSLIAAAQIIIALNPKPKQPVLTGRAHIPEGHVLVGSVKRVRYNDSYVPWDLQPGDTVMQAGYWQARLSEGGHEKNLTTPLHFELGETLPHPPGWNEMNQTQRYSYFSWHYCGVAAPDTKPKHSLIAAGFARGLEVPRPIPNCKAGTACPQSGVWLATIPESAPDAKLFNVWAHQAYIEQGQTLPDASYWRLQNTGANLTVENIKWYFLEPWQGGSDAWIGNKPT